MCVRCWRFEVFSVAAMGGGYIDGSPGRPAAGGGAPARAAPAGGCRSGGQASWAPAMWHGMTGAFVPATIIPSPGLKGDISPVRLMVPPPSTGACARPAQPALQDDPFQLADCDAVEVAYVMEHRRGHQEHAIEPVEDAAVAGDGGAHVLDADGDGAVKCVAESEESAGGFRRHSVVPPCGPAACGRCGPGAAAK